MKNKAGIAAELYKADRDEKKLLERFAEVMSKRPDVSYLTQYLEYLEPRTQDLSYLMDWYVNTSLNEVLVHSRQPKWALQDQEEQGFPELVELLAACGCPAFAKDFLTP